MPKTFLFHTVRPAHWLLALSVIALSGCASIEALMGPGPAVLADKAQLRFSQQQYAKASVFYQRAARLAPEPRRSRYYLGAARAALRAGDEKLALRLLERVNAGVLGAQGQAKKQLTKLRAQIAGLPPGQALQIVAPPEPDATPQLAAGIWELRAQLLFRAGRVVDGVHALVQRHIWLLNPEAVKQNTSRIWQALQAADPSQYQAEPGQKLGRTTRGWLALARISAQDWQQRKRLEQALTVWARRYPGHPATDTILPTVFGYSPSPAQIGKRAGAEGGAIGIALPLSGDHAPAAQAILDGFLAAYYQQAPPRPDLHIYDTHALPSGTSVVARAAADGVSILVGPLTKKAVNRLAAKPAPPISVLALNYTDTHGRFPGFYQFGLSPEDEARAVAKRAVSMGWTTALALVPRGQWGQRVLDAFRQTLTRLGGKLISYAYFVPYRQDHAKAIKQLLNAAGGSNTLDRADFIFMAAQPMNARLLRTQLRFFGATDIPVLATSHIYAPAANGQRHGDLDGVMFADMPWMLGTHHAGDRKRRLSDTWGTATGSRARLFAMGLDAWALAKRLREHPLRPGTLFQGATGELYLQPDGQIRRRLDWAKFVHGRPEVLPERGVIRLPGRDQSGSDQSDRNRSGDPGTRTRNPPGPIGVMPAQAN